MPTKTIPLVGSFTARGIAKSIGSSAKDQQYINCLIEVAGNALTNTKSIFCIKRAGSADVAVLSSAPRVLRNYSSAFTNRMFIDGTTVYKSTTNLGTITGGIGPDMAAADSIFNGVPLIAFIASDGTGYYCYNDAVTTNFPTFSGDTHTNTTIDNIASTTGIYPGQILSGTGIVAGTRVATITSSTAITVDTATTGTATVTITKEAIAKITTFVANAVSMEALDGYLFAATSDGKIYNCPLNTPASWPSANYLSADYGSDDQVRLFKFGNIIYSLGSNTVQGFENVGNTSGSVLARIKSIATRGTFFSGTSVSNPTQIVYVNGIPYGLARMGGLGGAFSLARFTGGAIPDFQYFDIPSAILRTQGLVRIGTAIIGNKSLVVCYDGSDTSILAFDVYNNQWSVITTGVAISSSFGVTFTKAASSTTFDWSQTDVWQDSGAAYTMTIQTEPFLLNGGAPFILDEVELIADDQASGTTSLYTYKDDYVTASTERTFDMTVSRKRLTRFGRFPRHVIFSVQHSANTAWRGQALRVTWRPCK